MLLEVFQWMFRWIVLPYVAAFFDQVKRTKSCAKGLESEVV